MMKNLLNFKESLKFINYKDMKDWGSTTTKKVHKITKNDIKEIFIDFIDDGKLKFDISEGTYFIDIIIEIETDIYNLNGIENSIKSAEKDLEELKDIKVCLNRIKEFDIDNGINIYFIKSRHKGKNLYSVHINQQM